MHRDKQKPYTFFVVPRGGAALLGMPGVKTLEQLSGYHKTMEVSQKNKKIKEQTSQNKVCIKFFNDHVDT